jgi:hypothetical protein
MIRIDVHQDISFVGVVLLQKRGDQRLRRELTRSRLASARRADQPGIRWVICVVTPCIKQKATADRGFSEWIG